MKNKKVILKILLVLIVLVAVALVVVIALGTIRDKNIKSYQTTLEEAACKAAEEEGYTKELCKAFTSLCNKRIMKLAEDGYVDVNLQNPITREYVIENTDDYVLIDITEDGYVCTYKEG